MTSRGPEPVVNEGEGTAPCCDVPRWPDCRTCPHRSSLVRLQDEMDDDRPLTAALPCEYPDPELVEAVQMAAFEAGVRQWWTVATEEALTQETDALERERGQA